MYTNNITKYFEMTQYNTVANKKTPIYKIFDWRSNESIKYTDIGKS